MFNTAFNLSDLFRDSRLKAAFKRAERDQGFAFAVPSPKRPELIDGAALSLEIA